MLYSKDYLQEQKVAKCVDAAYYVIQMLTPLPFETAPIARSTFLQYIHQNRRIMLPSLLSSALNYTIIIAHDSMKNLGCVKVHL